MSGNDQNATSSANSENKPQAPAQPSSQREIEQAQKLIDALNEMPHMIEATSGHVNLEGK